MWGDEGVLVLFCWRGESYMMFWKEGTDVNFM